MPGPFPEWEVRLLTLLTSLFSAVSFLLDSIACLFLSAAALLFFEEAAFLLLEDGCFCLDIENRAVLMEYAQGGFRTEK